MALSQSKESGLKKNTGQSHFLIPTMIQNNSTSLSPTICSTVLCVIIRKTFWETVNRQEYTFNPPHSGHFFDYLRQSIQCNADNTPLYSFGDYTAGDGQIRKCKYWNALRQWATKHTACYKDSVEDIPLKGHFGFCDDGKDNLIDLEEVQ
ncbi:uncharacterized protein TRUGW13939_11389 [Talaromyces rugulosus]|uniref:Uncharacterized protein n=1 Tax=Talaromyces rugulosus TaxID=121627 RepID=A0A7H8RDB9_TALRU|nr:uncharacterized protein TRUGW13939_11389 [Talaromyces rugulosus]QKX64216.1 hypothetical protein TRUGW13939_11389 [Talaromyces rugulosus]